MTIKRTFKYYLKLTNIKQKKLDQFLEISCRFHNHLLKGFRERDQKKEKQPTEYQLISSIPQIKENNPFFKQVYSTTLQEIAKQVYKI